MATIITIGVNGLAVQSFLFFAGHFTGFVTDKGEGKGTVKNKQFATLDADGNITRTRLLLGEVRGNTQGHVHFATAARTGRFWCFKTVHKKEAGPLSREPARVKQYQVHKT